MTSRSPRDQWVIGFVLGNFQSPTHPDWSIWQSAEGEVTQNILWKLKGTLGTSYHNDPCHAELIAATGLVIVLKLVSIRRFFRPCDVEIWWMTPKNNRAPLLYYIKLCASFQIHQWIQTGITVWKRPIWVKIDDFFSRVTLQLDRWPWKTIGHLFYAASSFMHHFVAIGEFKLELQSGNTQFGSNSTIFRAVWPWNLTDDLEKQ